MSTRDRYTFQYAELKHGKSSAMAVASVAEEFIHSYHTSKHYDVLLTSVIEELLDRHQDLSEESMKLLQTSLADRLNAILADERAKEKRPKKWMPTKPKVNLDESSCDDDVDPEEEEKQKLAEVEAEKRREENQRLADERYEEMQRRKEENDAMLKARARQVDTSSFEQKLKAGNVVVINAKGNNNAKNNKKGGGNNAAQMTKEETGKLFEDVSAIAKEKERLKTVLSTSEEEFPAAIAQAKTTLAELEASAKTMGTLVNKKAETELNKGQITQMQQKLTKLRMERDRLQLQLVSSEANSSRDELASILAAADAIAVQIELSS